MINQTESAHYSTHFVAATIVSFWLTLCQTNAQSRETAFGELRVSSIPASVDRFAASQGPSNLSMLYFWTEHGSTLLTATMDSTQLPSGWKEHVLKSPVDEFMVVDFPFEMKRVGVGIDRLSHSISFYTDLTTDSLRPSSSVQLPFSPSGVAFGDLNGDKKTDFVAFDRETPGLLPFFGIGGEKFKPGKPIAADNAVGCLKLVHLNNDGLLDIVLYDWVRSELHYLYGVGQGKFLDQASTQVDADVKDFGIWPLKKEGKLDIILSSRRPARLEILKGDGLGDFKSSQRINLKEPLLSFTVKDINGDGYEDIVGLDGASCLHAFLNNGDDSFDDHFTFVAGRDVPQFALIDHGSTDLQDALLLDRSSRQMVRLINAQHPSRWSDSVDFATGLRPRGVTVADLNGDGLKDIVLVTGGDNAISLFFNAGSGSFYGQLEYPLPASAHDVAFHSYSDSTVRLLISYPESRQVSLLTFDERDRTSTNATVGTERPVEFIYWNGMRKPSVDFFSFSPPTPTIPASLTLFQEIASHQFIEQSFRLLPSNILLGAGVGKVNADPLPDVAYVYRNNVTAKYELAVALGDSLSTYKQKTFSIELSEKNIVRSFVWVVDLDWKGHPDIVMLHAGPSPVLERMRWLRENTFGRPDTIALNLRIVDGAQVTFADIDGDGIKDIVINESELGEIGWLRARGTTFDAFRPLCSVPPRCHFAIGDLNGDGIPDFAVTYPDSGHLRIYDGRALIRKSLENTR